MLDLTPRVKHWVKTTDQVMGNWVSREEITRELNLINLEKVPVYEKDFPIADLNNALRSSGKITVIGFDVLQVPRYVIVYEYKNGLD